jgi:alpha-glucuronidase
MLSSPSRDDASPPHAPKRAGRGRIQAALLSLVVSLLAVTSVARAESGYDAWLRYERLDEKILKEQYTDFPAIVISLGDSEIIGTARDELVRGVRGMVGHTLRIESKLPKETAIVLATFQQAKKAFPSLDKLPTLADDGYWLKSIQAEGQNYVLVTAPNDRGVLYGVFALLRKVALAQSLAALNERQVPAAPLRMITHWDDLSGAVDRDTVQRSIFWNAGRATKDLNRVRDYARLLASIGINAISINDPDAGPRLTSPATRKELGKINAAMRPWGLQILIALNSTSSPAAPGNQQVRNRDQAESWNTHVSAIYADLPDLGGFVIDADWAAGESQADAVSARAAAINTIAAALKPHKGMVLCRTCVCGRSIDGDGQSPPEHAAHDPAKAAHELFQPLDGRLDDNVVLQIKHGPMDFQVREPPSPLLGSLEKTNSSIEFQLTQDHLGQQRHLCFLVPMWKQVLEFNMRAKEKEETPVKAIVAGKAFERPLGGFVAVCNARRVDNWLGHDLAMANLYGFGRLAWDPSLTGKSIAEEWTRLTFGHDPLVVGTVVDMLLKSWRVYESYTGPLGAGTLTDVAETHFGPGIESSTATGWAPWHSADDAGIGKDRTVASGSAFVGQYRRPITQRFESLQTCPDELLLFMHRVPYTHALKSGKTVIQHIYDAHYDGARDAARLAQQWQSLKGKVDDSRYEAVLQRLEYQAGHAELWRDAVCSWFLDKSGIADNEGRVGNYPNRFEAEAMQSEGYEPQNVKPWETASGGQCAQLVDPSGNGAVTLKFDGKAGWFDLNIRYFDESDGASKYRLLVAGQLVDKWTAGDKLPDNKPGGHTSTRHETRRVALRPGDEIRIEATADGAERAAIDYLEIDGTEK